MDFCANRKLPYCLHTSQLFSIFPQMQFFPPFFFHQLRIYGTTMDCRSFGRRRLRRGHIVGVTFYASRERTILMSRTAEKRFINL